MAEAKASVFNVEINQPKVELGDAAKEGRTAFEVFMKYVAPDRTRLLRRIAREEDLKDAAAEEKKRLMRVEGEVRELHMLAEAERELLEQAVLRLGIRGIIRERNLLNISEKLKELGPQLIAEEPVNEQVMLDIIDNCQDEGDEDMQMYWAKLIRGECAKPGSFSPKTRAVLKTLRKEDAELFTKLCSFSWGFPNEAHKFIPHTPMGGPPVGGFFDPQYMNLAAATHDLVEAAVPYFRRVELEYLGLIKMSPSASQGVFRTITSAEPLNLHYFGTCHTIRWNDSSPPFKRLEFAADYFTPAGNELFSLCNAQPNEDFRQGFLKTLLHLGFVIDESPTK
jgi:hypothetical protein